MKTLLHLINMYTSLPAYIHVHTCTYSNFIIFHSDLHLFVEDKIQQQKYLG